MGRDFPAAHSMDTHWFAVDQDGHVGLFFTAESGFMPLDASSVEGDDLIDLYRVLAGEEPPGLDEDGAIDGWDEFLVAFGGLGFYDYNFVVFSGDPDELLRPYTLWGEPEGEPLHVDQLPPAWRERCGKCRLAAASFGDDRYLQPFELCAGPWFTYGEGACAYLSADVQTVRPIPGREEKYQGFCRERAEDLKTKGWRTA
jgi:hypothetical protein